MNQNIQKDKGSMLKYAMNYGIILGLFWFVKYSFLIASSYFIHFIYLFNLLSIGTLLLYYVLLNRYRDKALGGTINYLQCLGFSILLFFFASIIESVIIYTHVAIINTSYIADEGGKTFMEIIESFFREVGLSNKSIKGLKYKPIPSNAFYVTDKIFANTLIGFGLSLIYGLFVRRTNNTLE